MKLLNRIIPPVGMGCWQIGGDMFSGDMSIGYSRSDDAQSRATIDAALDAGIKLFDTAPAYGAGHSEKLLGEVLGNRDDVLVVTKFGLDIEEGARRITGQNTDPASVLPAIESSLCRLRRDRIDVLLLHLNSLDVAEALPMFDEVAKAHDAGKIGTFGWSTDYTDNLISLDGRTGFGACEHAMNVFFDPVRIQSAIAERDLVAFIRSPLAMGLLTGKFDTATKLPEGDVRASGQTWLAYFEDGRPSAEFLSMLDAVRELLQTGGRTLTQGALGWLWAKSEKNFPVPGARTPEQIRDTAGAIDHGPLPDSVMAEIESLIDRGEPEPERDR